MAAAQIALQKNQSSQRRIGLCREAEPLIEKSLAEMEKDHHPDKEFLEVVRQAGEQCKVALSNSGAKAGDAMEK